MRRLLVVLGSGVLIALAAGTHFATPFSPRAETNRYLTAPIERGDLVETLQATGSLTARVTVAVGSEVSGQIAETVVDFNDEVREGEVLARLDPRSYESRVRAAEASLAVAKAATDVAKAALRRAEARVHGVELQLIEADAEVDRARAMALEGRRTHERAVKLEHTLAEATIEEAEATHKAVMADLRAARARRSVVDQTLLAARAELAAARADVRYAEAAVAREVALLDQASLDLERTVIRSPVDGVVISREVDSGQTVAASLEAPQLFTIAEDLTKMWVLAAVDEADVGRVRVGQKATFTVDAFPGRGFAAEVVDIRKSPQVVENVVAYTVVLNAANPDRVLLPGMTAVVNLVTAHLVDVVAVPNTALHFEPSDAARTGADDPAEALAGSAEATVWTVGPEGIPQPVGVEVGFSDVRATELVGGSLKVGQSVIVGEAGAPARRSWLARLFAGPG